MRFLRSRVAGSHTVCQKGNRRKSHSNVCQELSHRESGGMSGEKLQKFTQYLKSRVAGSHVVQQECSRKESHGGREPCGNLGAKLRVATWYPYIC